MPDDGEIRVPIESDHDVVSARQQGRAMAVAMGFSVLEATVVATAISELARNMVVYSRSGEIRLRPLDGPDRQGLEIVAADQGPGIRDVQQALRDGFSTSGSLGLGLPGVRRLVDEFRIVSEEGRGTTVTVRKWRPMASVAIEWGVAARPLPGEAACGDAHVVSFFPGGVLVAALDGLGHGDGAAAAARIASGILQSHAQEPLPALFERCHRGLAATRGVAMTLASFTPSRSVMSWAGVGNVRGVLVRGGGLLDPEEEALLLRGGVVGARLPHLEAAVLPVKRGDTLVLATDGIGAEFPSELAGRDAPQRAAEGILQRYGRPTDDALVLVARYTGGRP